jgi:hypothetical protein
MEAVLMIGFDDKSSLLKILLVVLLVELAKEFITWLLLVRVVDDGETTTRDRLELAIEFKPAFMPDF